MTINKNDPRLTAYLLNEISNADRQLVEQALRESTELKAEVEILKKSLGLLQNQISEEDKFFSLTPDQRNHIFSKISETQSNPLKRFIRSPWGYATGGLITASFALMIFNHSLHNQVTDKAQAPTPVAAFVPQSSAPAKAAEKKKSEHTETAVDASMTLADAEPAPPAASLGAVVAQEGVSEGSGGGASSKGFQKMQVQSFVERRAVEHLSFSLESEPTLPKNVYVQLEKDFQQCWAGDRKKFETFEFNWSFQNKITELASVKILSPDQATCLIQKLEQNIDPKSAVLHFKVKTVSK